MIRVRYLGHKPTNWAAMWLIFGWLVGGFVHAFWGAEAVSTFRSALLERPLMWWPEMSFVGFALMTSPVALGALALWLVPATDRSIKVSCSLVGAGLALFVFGIAWDAGYGVALYSDRIVHREAGFGQPLHTDRFTDVRRTETSCIVRRRRGGEGAEPSYILQFADGDRIDIWRGSYARHRGSASERLAFVRVADAAATRAGVVRAPQRKPDGTLIGDPGCLSLLGDLVKLPASQLAPLFSVYQSELRPGEY